jgi:hypothetical protein
VEKPVGRLIGEQRSRANTNLTDLKRFRGLSCPCIALAMPEIPHSDSDCNCCCLVFLFDFWFFYYKVRARFDSFPGFISVLSLEFRGNQKRKTKLQKITLFSNKKWNSDKKNVYTANLFGPIPTLFVPFPISYS